MLNVKIILPIIAVLSFSITFGAVSIPNYRSFNLKLSTSKEFPNAFNNPGDCITRLFPGISFGPFFTKNTEPEENVDSIDQVEVFAQEVDGHRTPEIACLNYNEHIGNEFLRTEMVMKRGDEGWLWMSALKKVEDNKFGVYYREAALERVGGFWKIKVGHEGLITEDPVKSTFNETKPKFDNESFGKITKLDANTGKKCGTTKTPCVIEAKAGYWLRDENSTVNLVEIASSTGNAVVTFSSHEGKRNKGKYRTAIYKEGKWFKDHNTDETENKLVYMNAGEVTNKTTSGTKKSKGTWKDIHVLCTAKTLKDDEKEYYPIFCQ